MIELWTINRVLRWTGLRVHLWIPDDGERAAGAKTKIGIGWYGLYGSRRWKRIEGTA